MKDNVIAIYVIGELSSRPITSNLRSAVQEKTFHNQPAISFMKSTLLTLIETWESAMSIEE